MAAQLLRECGADVVRYDRAEPHQVLHAWLGSGSRRWSSGGRPSCRASSRSRRRSRALRGRP
jgi:hypothetical protein